MATVNTVAPVLAPRGSPVGTTFNYVGNILSCSTGTWTMGAATSFAYAWQRDGSAISGATSAYYTLALADVGKTVTCNITATGDQTVTVGSNSIIGLPTTYNNVEVFVWGAGGGAGTSGGWSFGCHGGAGAAGWGFMKINTNTNYYVKIGGPGQPLMGTTRARNGGGTGLTNNDNLYGGGGGGFTGIFTTTQTISAATMPIYTASTLTAIMIIGGGGGGGAQTSTSVATVLTCAGGAGGALIGESGACVTVATLVTNGGNSTTLQGGAASTTGGTNYGAAGSALQGGNVGKDTYGGGGGAGYYGGAGGSYLAGSVMSGGGGGSSYFNTNFFTTATLYSGTRITPGNASHPLRAGIYGNAGINTGTFADPRNIAGSTGTQGVVIIRYPIVSSVLMVGGTITTDANYYYHTFTQDGYFFKFGPSPLVGTSNGYTTGNTNVDLMVIGGGGGGGSSMGGGGGAGGYITNIANILPNSYAITVGAGGTGALGGRSQRRGLNGGDSSFLPLANTNWYSYYFDSDKDWLIIPYDTAWNIGPNDASVECWIWMYKPSLTNSLTTFFGQNTGTASTIRIGLNSANVPFYTINNDTARGAYTATPAGVTNVISTQTWYHFVVTITGGTSKFFVNGSLRDVTTGNGNVITRTEPFYVGSEDSWGFNGYISNLRFVNGSIPTSYQTASVTTNTTIFSVPSVPLSQTSQGATSAHVKILTCQTSTIVNIANTLTAIIVSNNVTPSLWTPFTSYTGYVAIGGGGGGSEYDLASITYMAASGGSGGGQPANVSINNTGTQGVQTTEGIQGNAGGLTGGNYYPGGGGGAASTGTNGSSSIGGNGGNGYPNPILGTTYYWAGGGGGAGYSYLAGNGGLGGGGGGAPFAQSGGAGSYGGYGDVNSLNTSTSGGVGLINADSNVPGGYGGTNTGGGGGGGSYSSVGTNNSGGNGGSGIVVIRYIGSQRANGGIVYSYTTGTVTYTAHVFLSSGVFTIGYNSPYPRQNGGKGNPYGGGGGGAGGYPGTSGGTAIGGSGGSGVTLSAGTIGGQGGGGGGGASTADANGGGGGVDLYGQNRSGAGGAIGLSGLGGSAFNSGGQPALNGNGGLYGGGGAGGQSSSVDTSKGNGADGALLIVYTGTNFTYPTLMPIVNNAVGNPNSSFDLNLATTGKTTIPDQFNDVVIVREDIQRYSTLSPGIALEYNLADIISTKESQTSIVSAYNALITTYIIDHEMMLKNSNPSLPANYKTPGNYQFIQEVTNMNDPRLITVRLKNYVVGVTGETPDTADGKQTWY